MDVMYIVLHILTILYVRKNHITIGVGAQDRFDIDGKMLADWIYDRSSTWFDRFYVGLEWERYVPNLEIRIQFGLSDYLRKVSVCRL